ncbi:interleukin-7 receptor subunit alpha isoform X2 [Notothenia coriiceps]|uniref:Interleukin-7 receptor subunit alpha isoform X2 n=1 Tax=Notothenia coriiceps TaxID=8208 RepID=A0A6I9N2G7_9TELE|nr:PREDICTED: interleukin-7 receptor subunit alpha isoform X2 [Notothenia coriiceps]
MDSQVLIRLQSPDSNDYLRDDNQLFQIQLWRGGRSTNLSSPSLLLVLDQYRVRGRSLPVNGLQGSWSSWSPTLTLPLTPPLTPPRRPALIGGLLVLLLLLPSGLLLLLKNRIFSYVWPNIPHPKHTLMHICKSNKGLMLTLRPEEFSSLKLEKTGEAAPPPSPTGPSPSEEPSCGGGSGGGNEYVTMSSFMQSD